ncbi:MAG: Mrp/NBP35 family ATP-binding protein [Gemmatimonadales bacterium]|nr:Mrp/NBP35 family ATP-binding protein [Gemmatimonadales bacterium]
MSDSVEARVGAALSRVVNPRIGSDLLSAGMIRDLVVSPEGRVTFTFLLGRSDPATLVREARAALKAIDGVTEVKITVVDPAGPAQTTHQPPAGGPAGPQSTGMPAAPQPVEFPNLGRVIAISSGKGGVGKSTVAANLAVALVKAGKRVGLMDADVYGPNIPRMFGVYERPPVMGGRIHPLEAFGVKLMSIGFLVDRDAPAIWRGPIIMKVINQFLRDVAWGELDYFLVDMPPGTGDAQLSLVQSAQVSGAVIVTTPQEMAVGDALRGAKMFEKVNVPVYGIVENMSGYTDPTTGQRIEFFSAGGGKRLADELGVPLLGQVPLQPGLADQADQGRPIVDALPASPAAKALSAVADAVAREAAGRSVSLPVINQ